MLVPADCDIRCQVPTDAAPLVRLALVLRSYRLPLSAGGHAQ